MADDNSNRYTRAARAAMLAEKHPQVEEFEEAGGVVEDLPGKVGTEFYNYELGLEPRAEWRGGPYPYEKFLKEDANKMEMKVASSPTGGETPAQALDSAESIYQSNMQQNRMAVSKGHAAIDRIIELEKKGVPRADLAWYELEDLMKRGIALDPELEKHVKDAARSFARAGRYGGEIGPRRKKFPGRRDRDDLRDMAQDIYEETPFGKRAKAFRGKNPGKPYREEGGE